MAARDRGPWTWSKPGERPDAAGGGADDTTVTVTARFAYPPCDCPEAQREDGCEACNWTGLRPHGEETVGDRPEPAIAAPADGLETELSAMAAEAGAAIRTLDEMVDGALVALGPPTDWPAELVDALGVEITARFARRFRALTLDERRMMRDVRAQAGAWMAVRMLARGRLRAMPANAEAWYRERVTRSTLHALRVGREVERAVPDELLTTTREEDGGGLGDARAQGGG